MATNPGYAGPTNGFIANFEDSGKLISAYARNPKKYKLARYAQLKQAKKTAAYYLKLSSQEARRVLSQDQYKWNWDQPQPQPTGESQYTFVPIEVSRYVHGFTLGNTTKRQAEWDIEEWRKNEKANQAMVARTKRAYTVLSTTANWAKTATYAMDMSVDHYDTATSIAGGKLDAGASTTPYLRKFFNAVEKIISADTGTVVNRSDLVFVCGPDDANRIGASAELVDYLKGSPDAKQELEEGAHPNAQFGLPSIVYGMEIVVDDTRINTAGQGIATSEAYIWTAATCAVMCRPGGIDGGVAGGPTFSTLTGFWCENDMVYESFDDPKNKMSEHRVVVEDGWYLTSANSGFLVTSATG